MEATTYIITCFHVRLRIQQPYHVLSKALQMLDKRFLGQHEQFLVDFVSDSLSATYWSVDLSLARKRMSVKKFLKNQATLSTPSLTNFQPMFHLLCKESYNNYVIEFQYADFAHVHANTFFEPRKGRAIFDNVYRDYSVTCMQQFLETIWPVFSFLASHYTPYFHPMLDGTQEVFYFVQHTLLIPTQNVVITRLQPEHLDFFNPEDHRIFHLTRRSAYQHFRIQFSDKWVHSACQQVANTTSETLQNMMCFIQRNLPEPDIFANRTVTPNQAGIMPDGRESHFFATPKIAYVSDSHSLDFSFIQVNHVRWIQNSTGSKTALRFAIYGARYKFVGYLSYSQTFPSIATTFEFIRATLCCYLQHMTRL